jgi:crossover junction endodeoxyribonuclease RuvC
MGSPCGERRVALRQASGLERRIPRWMIVLGLDPGLANTGYGVVVRDGARLTALDGGVIETPAGLATERRLSTIAGRIRELLAEHNCQTMALEELYFGQNARTAFAVGHARGVMMLCAGEHGVPCFSYTPQQVKSAVCGHGRAGKEQVARMVQTLLALPAMPAKDHASDALAVAICHVNGTPLADAVARATGGTEAASTALAGIAR